MGPGHDLKLPRVRWVAHVCGPDYKHEQRPSGAAPVVAGLGGVVLDTRALHSKTPKGKFGPNLVLEIDGFRSCKTNRIDSNRDRFGTIWCSCFSTTPMISQPALVGHLLLR